MLLVTNPSAEAFDALLAENETVVVDFYATWCGPCKSYSPKFARAAREVRRAVPDRKFVFVAVDVDLNHALARRHGVQSVPTTVALRKGKSWLGREKVLEALRYAGDRPWLEMLRDLTAVVEEPAKA